MEWDLFITESEGRNGQRSVSLLNCQESPNASRAREKRRPVLSVGSMLGYSVSMAHPRILYCHCQYAQVLPKEVKEAVLKNLCQAGVEFEAVADLCELSARRDPLLRELAGGGPLKIAACFPRAVKWLFAAAGAPLDSAASQVVNLRVDSAETASAALLEPLLSPNLPQGNAFASAAGSSLSKTVS